MKFIDVESHLIESIGYLPDPGVLRVRYKFPEPLEREYHGISQDSAARIAFGDDVEAELDRGLGDRCLYRDLGKDPCGTFTFHARCRSSNPTSNVVAWAVEATHSTLYRMGLGHWVIVEIVFHRSSPTPGTDILLSLRCAAAPWDTAEEVA